MALSSSSQIQNLYRITDGSFADHVEYHQVDLPPGKELELKENQNVILNALRMATDIRQAFTVDNSGCKGGVGGCKS